MKEGKQMINTNDLDKNPLKLYDIKTDNLVEKNLPEFIDFFTEYPNHMINKPTIVGYSITDNCPEVFDSDYELTSDIIAKKVFSVNKNISDTKEYAIATLKRYARWLKSERTRQSKAINTVDKTINLVKNRRNRGAVNTLLFPISNYTKWLIDHLDVIDGDSFEEMTLLNHNNKKYYLDLTLIKLKHCSKINSSTVNSITRELDYRSNYDNTSSIEEYEIAKLLYKIVNHDSNTLLIYDNKPVTCCGTLAKILVNHLHQRKITLPFGALCGGTNYWSFDDDQYVITFKLYNDQDVLSIIESHTNSWDGARTSIPLVKRILKQKHFKIDLNHNENLIKNRIKQLQAFASIPAFNEIVEIFQLILSHNK